MRADVVAFSRGVTSAVVAWLVAQEHRDTTTLLFHDPGEEPEDNDRFEREVSAFIGLPVVHDDDGRTVTELFEDEGALGNNRMTSCSRVLKQERSWAFAKRLRDEGRDVTLYFGFTPDELHRLAGRRQKYDSIGVRVEAPLVRLGWSHTDCFNLIRDCWGIEPSSAYETADNANCLGCVKGGLAYWGQMYLFHRAVWEQRASLEDQFGHTILHSRYGDYPTGSLRAMLPRCLEEAAKWRQAKQEGQGVLPLIELPCGCGK